MKQIFNFLTISVLLSGLIACNSNKKVENNDNKDISKFKLIGTVDTTKSLEVRGGDVEATDSYVDLMRRTLRSVKMRNTNMNGVNERYIIGGKGQDKIRTFGEETTANGKVSRDYYSFMGKVIYVEEVINETTPQPKFITYKYYIADDKIVKVLKGDMSSMNTAEGKQAGKESIKFSEVAISEANPNILEDEQKIIDNFSKINSYEGRITKQDGKYVFTGCFNNKMYTLKDEKGMIAKMFVDERVQEGNYLYADLQGTLSDDGNTITVISSNKQAAQGGIYDCYK